MSVKSTPEPHDCRDFLVVDQSDDSVIRCRICGRVIHRQPQE
jgi:ribosomal protein S27E